MKKEIMSDSSSSGDESEDLHQLTINEHFAKAYEYRKEREELAKLKEKYGSDAETSIDEDETDSEEDETEDDDGEELTPAMDAAILRTLARIKRKDPEIYQAGREVFNEEHQKTEKAPALLPKEKVKENASKPLTLPALRLAAVLDSNSRSVSPEPAAEPTYTEEQERLRAETISAFHSNVKDEDAEDEDAEGGLFKLREKTRDEVAMEEEEYRKYLEREVGKLDDLIDIEPTPAREETQAEEDEPSQKEKKKKKKKENEKGKDGIKENDHEFLLNYILNRGWIDRSSKRVPTFEEVTGGTVGRKAKQEEKEAKVKNEEEEAGDEELVDDDEFDEVAERFESSYNFRFEEPDAPVIPSFPRSVPTVRRPAEHAERRKEARERRKERKEEEKRLRREEVKRLKGLKMREMEQRLKEVAHEGGFGIAKALQELDLEGEWDAEAHDRQMAAILAEAEADEAADDEKPAWDDDIDVADIVPPSEDEDEEPKASTSTIKKDRKKEKKKEKKKAKAKEGGEVDADGVDVDAMDAEAEPADWDEEEWDGTEEMRKRVLDKYMDELYGLEFNDMVGDMPTRFHYTRVQPSSYSLTPAEILMASDKDLNEYMGIKKLATYRKEKDRWDKRRPEKLREFKQKVSSRMHELGAVAAPAENGDKKQKKRKGKKERMRDRAEKEKEDGGAGEDVDMKESQPKAQAADKEKKKDKKRAREEEEHAADAPAEVDGEAGEPSKKKRRRQKKSGKGERNGTAE